MDELEAWRGGAGAIAVGLTTIRELNTSSDLQIEAKQSWKYRCIPRSTFHPQCHPTHHRYLTTTVLKSEIESLARIISRYHLLHFASLPSTQDPLKFQPRGRLRRPATTHHFEVRRLSSSAQPRIHLVQGCVTWLHAACGIYILQPVFIAKYRPQDRITINTKACRELSMEYQRDMSMVHRPQSDRGILHRRLLPIRRSTGSPLQIAVTKTTIMGWPRAVSA